MAVEPVKKAVVSRGGKQGIAKESKRAVQLKVCFKGAGSCTERRLNTADVRV
jgi:hypothetical protein